MFTPKARREKRTNVVTYEHDQLPGLRPILITQVYSESPSRTP